MTKISNLTLVLLATGAWTSVPVLAQEARSSQAALAAAGSPGDSSSFIDEIVVTAQKRTERLQDVPLAVTAITAEALQARQINDTANLAQIAPSLTFQQGLNPTNSSFRIRGIGTALLGQGTESAVSVVLDGVVLARQAQGFTDLADIERIEVLRGPQGTLFGRNAVAGLINVVTKRPSDELSGLVKVTLAEQGEYRASGTISGPLAEGIGVRVTGFYNKDDGYIRNVVLGEKTNGFESYGVRGKLELDPSDRLNLLLTGEYRKNDAECCQSVLIHSDNPNLTSLVAPVVPGPQNRQVSSNLHTTSATSQQTYSLEANYDVDFANIVSITAYQKYKFNNNLDGDGINTPVPIFTGPSFAQFDLNGGPIDLDNFTQELRLVSSGEERLNYVFGLFYSNLNLDRGFSRRLAQCPSTGQAVGAVCLTPTFRSGGHTAHLDSENYAVFGQVDFNIVGGLKVIAGLRAQHESVAVQGTRTGLPLVTGDQPLFGAIAGRVSTDDDVVTGKGGLQYEFSRNAQAYATYTRGYKGKGLDTEVSADFVNQAPVKPETADAYEIGFKGTTLERKLSLSAALFLTDYKNLQVLANRSDPVSGSFVFVQTNAGTARTKGFEIEAVVRPDEHFSVSTSATYVHARANIDGLSCPTPAQAAPVTIGLNSPAPVNVCYKQTLASGALSGAIQNVRNGQLPSTPTWRFAVNPRYEHDVAGYTGFIDMNLAYQSDMTFSTEQDPALVQGGYALVDGSIGILPKGSGFNASVFVKNLFDKSFYTSRGRNTLLTTATLTPNNFTAFVPKNAARYFGVSAGYSF